jgi:hypothetical protein
MGTTPATNYKIDMLSTGANSTYARLRTTNATYASILEVSGNPSTTRLYAIGSTFRVGGGNALDTNSTSVLEGSASGGLFIAASSASADIRFFAGGITDGGEANTNQLRMNIKGSTGNVTIGMGNTTPNYRLDVLHASTATTDVGIRFRNTSAQNGRSLVLCSANVAAIGIYAYSGGYVSADGRRANSTFVEGTGTAGMSLAAMQGPMNFYVGGITQAMHRMIIGGNGNVGIAGYFYASNPTFNLSFGGDLDRTLGMERKANASGPGQNLTVSAGNVYSTMSDGAGGSLILAGGLSTGRNQSLVRLQGTTTSIATATTDNTRIDRLITGCTRTNWHNGITLFTALPPNGSFCGATITYHAELYGSPSTTYYWSQTGHVHCVWRNTAGAVTENGGFGASNPITDATNPLITLNFLVDNAGNVQLSANVQSNPWPGGISQSRIVYSIQYFGQAAISNLFQM